MASPLGSSGRIKPPRGVLHFGRTFVTAHITCHDTLCVPCHWQVPCTATGRPPPFVLPLSPFQVRHATNTTTDSLAPRSTSFCLCCWPLRSNGLLLPQLIDRSVIMTTLTLWPVAATSRSPDATFYLYLHHALSAPLKGRAFPCCLARPFCVSFLT